ncbi:hypothetical protein [Rivibacter subsaxonicus]|uniref:Uncharacterized protein n=1 Tax=Rivibacter subsaxonicus TaxID=457575 RepID=A0A4Q7VPC7_9BURK|nr:hypothetical protein [Rivibacter subsaxonicus]RZT98094.1 hypothetical protein EV670_2500 [Rivibacter subsaxonicus]
MSLSIRSVLTLIAAGLLLAAGAQAQGTAAPAKAAAAQPAAAKPAPVKKPVSQSRKELRNEAKGLALATDVTETISDNQLQIANRVLTGTAQCEFNQGVTIDPVAEKPGMFRVVYKQVAYVMVPQETTTGAVRLEDKRSGVVWLQIPSKSMMMDQTAGKRLVDSCTMAEQRAAVAASVGAASSLGINADNAVKEPEALKAAKK